MPKAYRPRSLTADGYRASWLSTLLLGLLTFFVVESSRLKVEEKVEEVAIAAEAAERGVDHDGNEF
jgi:hypothetical protein